MGIFHVKVSSWKAEQRLVESGCIIVLFNGFSSQYPKHGKAYPTECTAPHHQYSFISETPQKNPKKSFRYNAVLQMAFNWCIMSIK